MFGAEPLKPSNTGRLIADILPDTQAFLWSRTEIDPALLAAINDPARQPYVVFPLPTPTPNGRCSASCPPAANRRCSLCWTAPGRKRAKCSVKPVPQSIPGVFLNVDAASDYQLREASRAEQHCTAEVAAALLQQAGDLPAADGLNQHFRYFRQQYLAGKPTRPEAPVTAM